MTLRRTDWKGVVGALGLLLVSATLILAHDLFLKPESFLLPPQSDVRIAVLNGSFSTSEASVTPDRLRDLSLVGPAGRQPLAHEAWKPQGDSTWLTVHTGAAGTYLIGASLFPRALSLPAAQFNAYLKEDGIPDVLAARTRAGELNKPARERYQKHVKTLLQVGEARASETPLRSAASSTGSRRRVSSSLPAASRAASRPRSARRAAIRAAWCVSPSSRRGSGM